MSDTVFLTVWGTLPTATATWDETVLFGRDVPRDRIPTVLAQIATLATRDGIRNVRHVIESAPAVPNFAACVR